jgi:hypothetical protein
MADPIERCTAVALKGLTAETVARFADKPVHALQDTFGLIVQSVDNLNDARGIGGVCDGVSFLRDGVVMYRRTDNRRENFTLAHELGHWLVDRAPDVYDTLAPFTDSGRMLETVCDRIASLLLLPAESIDRILDGGPVEARHVGALRGASRASTPVCAIALAERLPGLGAVVVIDRASESIEYASVHPDFENGWPVVHPWPGELVPLGHPLRNLAVGGHMRQRTFWADRWDRRAHFYVDAIEDASRTVAVFSDTDLWQAELFHPDGSREYDQRPTLEVHCCGRGHQVRGWPCSTCRTAYCPTCGKCRCDRQADAEVLCSGGCFMKYRPHLLVDGLCEMCR